MGADNWYKPEPNLCKVFLSLHADGSRNSSAHGFSCGLKVGTNEDFKEALAVSYKKFTGFTRRRDNYTPGLANYYAWTFKGTRRYHHVLAEYYCLLEHGFMTNPGEREWMTTHINQIAAHHVKVIKAFLK